MLTSEHIATTFARNRKAVGLRPSVGQGTAVTRIRVREGMTCDIEDGRWKLTAGMSEKSGGAGAGPDPGVFGRSAIGSCVAIGYVLWASEADVPIDSLEVEVQTDYDSRGEYDLDESVAPVYAQVRVVVTVASSAPEADVLRVLDRADRCSPWLRMLAAPDVRREVRFARGDGSGS